jgi:hypothetical protein
LATAAAAEAPAADRHQYKAAHTPHRRRGGGA